MSNRYFFRDKVYEEKLKVVLRLFSLNVEAKRRIISLVLRSAMCVTFIYLFFIVQ